MPQVVKKALRGCARRKLCYSRCLSSTTNAILRSWQLGRRARQSRERLQELRIRFYRFEIGLAWSRPRLARFRLLRDARLSVLRTKALPDRMRRFGRPVGKAISCGNPPSWAAEARIRQPGPALRPTVPIPVAIEADNATAQKMSSQIAWERRGCVCRPKATVSGGSW